MLDKQKELDTKVRTVKDKVMVSTMCQQLQCNHSNSSQSVRQLRGSVAEAPSLR